MLSHKGVLEHLETPKIDQLSTGVREYRPVKASTLPFIYLAVLRKSDDVQAYGYEKVLQPLLQDLCILENHGIFISQLGQFAKGSVQCVIADNLAAHGISGFVESFSAGSICRFYTGEKSEFLGQVLSNLEPGTSMMLMSRLLRRTQLFAVVSKNSAF